MPTPQLEQELRFAFAERAAEVPPDAVARLRRTDYGPRGFDVRPRAALAGAAGVAGAAAAAVAVVSLTAGAGEAFAGWTASPSKPSAARMATSDADCKARLAQGPSALPADATPVLSEARGPFTFLIYAGKDYSASCVTGPGFASVTGTQGTDTGTAPAGQIRLSSQHLTTRDGHEYTLVEGHAGIGVSAATLSLSDSTQVDASISNGWFAAWWPGAGDVSTAKVTTPSGTVSEHLTTGGPGPCGTRPGTCTRHLEGSGTYGMAGGSTGSGDSASTPVKGSGSMGTLAP